MKSVIIGKYDISSLFEVIDSTDYLILAKVLDEAIFKLIYDRLRNGSCNTDEDDISNLRFLRDGLVGIKNISEERN